MFDSKKKIEINIAACKIKVAVNDEIRYKADLDTDKKAATSLARHYKVLDLTVDGLNDHLKARHNIAPIGYDKAGQFHRSKEDFKETQFVACDFDNPIPERYITFDEALEHTFIKQNAAILYETASSTPTHNRFRPLYILPHPITDHSEIDEIILAFMWKHSDTLDADESCKDRSRFFFGAKENGRIVVLNHEPMSEAALATLLSEYRAAMEAVRPKATEKTATVHLPHSFSEDAEGRRRQYGERAIETAKQIIYNSQPPQQGPTGKIPGNRHNARLRAGRLLGGYVAGGMLMTGEIEPLMSSVIMANTDNYLGAMKTFRDAIYYGMLSPISFEQKESERTRFISRQSLTAASSRNPRTATEPAEERRRVMDEIRIAARENFGTSQGDLSASASECVDMFNFIFSRSKCPARVRLYILAVVGSFQEKSEGQQRITTFKATDFEIGLRLRGDAEDRPDTCMSREEVEEAARREGIPIGKWRARFEQRRSDRIKKTAQRERKACEDWQKKTGYIFITCESGGKSKVGQNQKSRYTVPILKEVTEALIQARARKASASRKRDAERAIRVESKLALERLEGTYTKIDRYRRPGRKPKDVFNSNHKLILTKFERNIDLTVKINMDPQEYRDEFIEAIDSIMHQRGFVVDSKAGDFVHIKQERDMDKSRYSAEIWVDKSVLGNNFHNNNHINGLNAFSPEKDEHQENLQNYQNQQDSFSHVPSESSYTDDELVSSFIEDDETFARATTGGRFLDGHK
jgi:hypothetical protein